MESPEWEEGVQRSMEGGTIADGEGNASGLPRKFHHINSQERFHRVRIARIRTGFAQEGAEGRRRNYGIPDLGHKEAQKPSAQGQRLWITGDEFFCRPGPPTGQGRHPRWRCARGKAGGRKDTIFCSESSCLCGEKRIGKI